MFDQVKTKLYFCVLFAGFATLVAVLGATGSAVAQDAVGKNPIPMMAQADEPPVMSPPPVVVEKAKEHQLPAIETPAPNSVPVAENTGPKKDIPSVDKKDQEGPEDLVPADSAGMILPMDAASVEGAVSEESDQKVPDQKAAEAALQQEAFEAMMTGLLPLQPEKIREAMVLMDKNEKAIEEPLAYPKPQLDFTTISLDPGSTPLTFKLATGHVTTVTFLDISGAPWPIKDISWAGNIEVKAPTASDASDRFYLPPNVLRIIPQSEYAYGNISMRFVGLPTPVTFSFRTGRDVVQYRLDIRIPQMGPFAQPPLIEGGVTGLVAGDAMLTQVMEGAVPSSAEKLNVNGVDGRTSVYRVGGLVYVRTPLTLLSPGWSSSVRSADGMNVYTINDAPVLLLSDEGRMVRAQINDITGDDDEQ